MSESLPLLRLPLNQREQAEHEICIAARGLVQMLPQIVLHITTSQTKPNPEKKNKTESKEIQNNKRINDGNTHLNSSICILAGSLLHTCSSKTCLTSPRSSSPTSCPDPQPTKQPIRTRVPKTARYEMSGSYASSGPVLRGQSGDRVRGHLRDRDGRFLQFLRWHGSTRQRRSYFCNLLANLMAGSGRKRRRLIRSREWNLDGWILLCHRVRVKLNVKLRNVAWKFRSPKAETKQKHNAKQHMCFFSFSLPGYVCRALANLEQLPHGRSCVPIPPP